MSKILDGLKEFLEVAKCDHEFEYLGENAHRIAGVRGYCNKCKCRVTAWPNSMHYDEIVAARDRQRQGSAG